MTTTQLLPSLQSERIRSAVVDYLSTTFALTDAPARSALQGFLEDPDDGVFHGPFVRLRLPYLPAEPDQATPATVAATDHPLDWTPPFPPYRHQHQAWTRLTTKPAPGATTPRRPEPTLVTTGTGSGKTESFLYPILDHVLRARAAGERGIKALILYPMNALATDQAGRLAQLITSDPALGHITAALYTGDTEEQRGRVTPDSLITDRAEIRRNPPDILLTNYKMLDQLLLRPEDQTLWRASAPSLTYLVLDEFHTYDGAQGTDVAMLLRRLGLALRHHLDADDPRQEAFTDSPLGPVVPVATSATLGDGDDPSAMLSFARDVFGFDFPPEAAVTETRVSLDDWAAPHQAAAEAAGLTPRSLRTLADADFAALAGLTEIPGHASPPGTSSPEPSTATTTTADPATTSTLLAGVLDALYVPSRATDGELPSEVVTDPALQAAAIQAHPDVLALIAAAQQATPLAELTHRIFNSHHASDAGTARRALSALLAALSTIRAGRDGHPDRGAVSVEVTLWLREVTRVDRDLSSNAAFRWSDPAVPTFDAERATPARPALYCRECGRSGWGITLAATGQGEKAEQEHVRRDHLNKDTRFRALFSATGEAQGYHQLVAEGEPDPQATYPGLRWYSVTERELLTRPPQEDVAQREGNYLPVLTLTGTEAEISKGSIADVCPSCGATDSIRFLGSAVATLLSVTLTTLFGDEALADAEKRALVFTDSVQDAAHRAGFVDQRSHTMSLRSALRGALPTETPLPAWVDATLAASAADPFHRYRLVPAALTDHSAFRPFWDPDATRSKQRSAATAVRRRLLFDATLEVGLQSGYGRTLEATGSVSVHVNAGRRVALERLARRALTGDTRQMLDTFANVSDKQLVAWVTGTLEYLRRHGGIEHEWLTRYQKESGARLWIWFKRKRNQGQPAFPSGRSAPAFPMVGGEPAKNSTFVPAGSAKSWYATWAKKCLSVDAQHGARLAVALLGALASEGVLTATETTSGGTVYAVPADRIMVTPLSEHDLADKPLLLVCGTCRTQLPVAASTLDHLEDAPCLTATCPGTLAPHPHPPQSFYRDLYRSGSVRRVDAHEHTSLLDGEERARIEAGFKRADQHPGDPNVLVATPTLEMGIDIGDLSTVMLASLPGSVASFVQRVGRAGRRNGSALALAYVPGRRDQLPSLEEPSRLLNGSVRPPSTYLGAEEILRRQFLASVLDRLAREGHPSVPGGSSARPDARAALGATSEGSLLYALGERIERDGAALASSFAAMFADATTGLERVVAWATEDAGAAPRQVLERAHADFEAERELLRRQIAAIQEALPELKETVDRPNATDEDERALRSATAALNAGYKRIREIEDEHWVSALERRGVLPNYALIDDTVRLAARVTWRDPDTDEFHSEPRDIDRGSQNAIREFAPGATFYAHGMEMRVDGIDGGELERQAEHWFCCSACGYVHVLPAQEADAPPPGQCPRCLDPTIADVGRRRRVVRLTRVFADVSRDDARIGDSNDQRTNTRFETHALADFDPARAERQWHAASSAFGLARYRRLHLRWLNTGRPLGGQAHDALAGWSVTGNDFRLCEACGKLDTATGTSSAREHRPWCEHRSDPTEHVLPVDLMRDLETEGLALILPPALEGDATAVNSLSVALFLGLVLTTGGLPQHLGITIAPHPVHGGDPGETRRALLVHDLVPGGTGYLTDLADPARLWELLVTTGAHLEACDCQNQERLLCHECLLPYVGVPVDGGRGAHITRAAAVLALRTILGVRGEGLIGELDPQVPAWEIEDAPVAHGSGESPLETRFRAELVRRLEGTASVSEQPHASGASVLVLDGGRWRIVPQVNLAGVRPDFLCSPADTRLPPITVFTDGWQYHASPSLNRLADDARKRESLRYSNYRVLSVAIDDLDGPWEPPWLSEVALTMLKSGAVGAARGAAITDEAVADWRGGPLGLLTTLLLEEGGSGRGAGAEARTALAHAAWGPLLIGSTQQLLGLVQRTPSTNIDPLREAVDVLAPDAALPGTSQVAGERATSLSVFTWPHLTLAVRLHGQTTTAMALVLDDRDEAVREPAFRESWLTWLRLSNVLQFAEAPLRVTTVTEALVELRESVGAGVAGVSGVLAAGGVAVGGAAEVAEAAEALGASGSASAPAETVARETATLLAELGWDVLDPTITDPRVLALAPLLAERRIAHADDGQELAGGIMADLSWPTERVVLLVPEAAADAPELEAAGWRVVVLDDGAGGAGDADAARRAVDELADALAAAG